VVATQSYCTPGLRLEASLERIHNSIWHAAPAGVKTSCMQNDDRHTFMRAIDQGAIRVTEPQIIDILDRTISRRRQLPFQNMKNETAQVEKAPTVLIRKIRDAIVDSVFKPGEWLPEVDLAKRFEVSRSPVWEALLALEKEGTVIMEPYKGAIVKPRVLFATLYNDTPYIATTVLRVLGRILRATRWSLKPGRAA